jgi:hypothetical protein
MKKKFKEARELNYIITWVIIALVLAQCGGTGEIVSPYANF